MPPENSNRYPKKRVPTRYAKALSISISPASQRRRAPETLESELQAVLTDVRTAVLDWRAMQQRLKEAVARYQTEPPPIPIEELTESIAFLQWLIDNHFTFLGLREYAFEGGARKGELKAIADTGLGLLRKPEVENPQARRQAHRDDA